VGETNNITVLLSKWSDGDSNSSEALAPLVYEELQRIARRLFRTESENHTLQPTALVHEAYVRLVDVEIDWQNRAHFFALAARMMRRLLINHAEARAAAKRGGGAVHVTLSDVNSGAPDAEIEFLDLNEALNALAAYNRQMAELVELQYFGGLTLSEMAAFTGVSERTIGRNLRFAKAWLKDSLAKEN